MLVLDAVTFLIAELQNMIPDENNLYNNFDIFRLELFKQQKDFGSFKIKFFSKNSSPSLVLLSTIK